MRMPEATCDLHMHSTASDGSDAPDSLPARAAEAGLSAIALTDHDTAAGVKPCAQAAEAEGLAFVPGIELSADPAGVTARKPRGDTAATAEPDASDAERAAGTLHILGYFIDPDDPSLDQLQRRLREAREQRNPAMIDKLNSLGVTLDYREVTDLAAREGSKAPGRPHIARLLVDKGYAKSIHDAFTRYIGSRGAAYVRKDRLTAAEAIDAIHQAGGLASFAHPVQLTRDAAGLEHAVARLTDMGLDAIETSHSDHAARDRDAFERLATRFSLLTTGGSDYHGTNKRIPLGSQHVPMCVYDNLYEAWQKRRRVSNV